MKGRFNTPNVDAPRCGEASLALNRKQKQRVFADQAELGRELRFKTQHRKFERIGAIPESQRTPTQAAKFKMLESRVRAIHSLRRSMIGQMFRHHVLIGRQHAFLTIAKRTRKIPIIPWTQWMDDVSAEEFFAGKIEMWHLQAKNAHLKDSYASMLGRHDRLTEVRNRVQEEYAIHDCVGMREALWRKQKG